MTSQAPKICLTIGGSDPSGGAGIQADLKTFEAWRTFGMSVLTLITAQNTQGVQAVELLSTEIVKAQLHSIFDDFEVDTGKIGALGDNTIIEAVADVLDDRIPPLLVLDPVMITKHGERLFDASGERCLVERMIPHAYLITPNLSEAGVLFGENVTSSNAQDAAHQLSKKHGVAVLITGGADEGNEVADWFSDGDVAKRFSHPRVTGPHQHGAGCTLSAAITAALAHGAQLIDAIPQAREYVWKGMTHAPHIGHGEGPLRHRLES